MEGKKKYDYLIVGAGLYGAMFAYSKTKEGKKCLVIERNSHIGGFCRTEKHFGIDVHLFGAHIFRTDNKKVWNFVNSITEFVPFVNSPLAKYHDEVYNLPFNMNTFYQLYGVTTPNEAKKAINDDCVKYDNAVTLDEHVLSIAGQKIYQKLVKEYTEKQWGKRCDELPPSIMNRIPLRFTFDNNYFTHRYQGIPEKGYTYFIQELLKGSDVLTDTKFSHEHENIASRIMYTGSVDELFNYELGRLEYRSVEFEHKTYMCDNYQGNAVINYTSSDVPYTRTIEHKHFLKQQSPVTVVSYETPCATIGNRVPSYPIPSKENVALYNKYVEIANDFYPTMEFGGRLGEYKYYSMNDIIEKFI